MPILPGTERPGPSPKHPHQLSVACMVGSSDGCKDLVEELEELNGWEWEA